ncbi:ADP-ribosylglycohydrolase family protein [Bdellovibrio svalbardensis]|uniref:ADP-ribosylglycohydrolase family protein n=1 Tax=Bdellovibrio svalbardensis TaxID=2972972 RepID=A0ABT6DGR8_9BACT|nr:ADP-ribosylglycohydrolase family protein [Bdellovibrio svalbardensis]MDG0816021.1 ADP-ribosylglycohydrolase family protein [Bdellovibrio svalbardensis]
MSEAQIRQDKVLGMLWGLHAGDSLGAPLEFLPPSESWNSQTEIVGGGKFNWKAGEATDDTDLMLCVMRAIQSSSQFSFDILKREMLAWYASNPPDIGTTTIKGLKNLAADLPLRDCGFVNNDFQGNGSIMRVAPMCLLDEQVTTHYQGETIVSSLTDVLITQTKMTHGHQHCVDCDLVFVAALKAALAGNGKNEIFAVAVEKAKEVSPLIAERLQGLLSLPWEQLPTSGFCVDTLCAGLYAFMNYNFLEESLVAVINRGDDSDSCGAVAGALCGAFHGSAAIPARWLNKLEFKEEIQQLVNAFFGQH